MKTEEIEVKMFDISLAKTLKVISTKICFLKTWNAEVIVPEKRHFSRMGGTIIGSSRGLFVYRSKDNEM